MVAVLLLALQAIAVVCPLPGNGALQTKTPDIHPQGFRSVATAEAPELLNNDVYEVSFVEGGEVLRGTGGHPLYSLDRADWVSVRDLQVGERLQTAEGAVTVEALEKVRGVHRVYNLEVEGDHEYLVGEAGVRAHNTCPANLSPKGSGRRGAFREAKRQSGVPVSQQPSRVTPNVDRRGNVQPGRTYEFDVPAEGGGRRTVRIRDDAQGHRFPDDPTQNRSPHFNDEAGNHFDY